MADLERVNGAGAFDAEVGHVLAAASRQGLDAEVDLSRSSATRVQVQDGAVETFTITESRGAGVRVVTGGRVGYAFTESFAPADLEQAVLDAAGNAALLPPDEAAGLGAFEDEPPALALFNPGLAEIPVDRKIAAALALDRAAREADPRVRTVTGVGYADVAALVRVASTRGVDRTFRESLARGVCTPIVTAGGENKTYGHSRNVRAFEDLGPETIARQAVSRCVEKLGAREIPSGRYPVVLHPEAFASLLETFSGVLSAKVAQEGKSLLLGRVGERIASAAFTLLDDPLLVEGFGARPFDDEGCPSRPLTLIGDGVFRGFLHNVETARRDGAATTGHAARGGYGGVLHVRPSNLVVQPGDRSPQDLLAAAPQVVLVTEVTGLHAGANPISGDFSLQAQGFLHGGSDRHPAHLFTVSGNFFELLLAIEAVGDDREVRPSGTSTPSVLVGGLTIAGR